jgi:hypothetical protein
VDGDDDEEMMELEQEAEMIRDEPEQDEVTSSDSSDDGPRRSRV